MSALAGLRAETMERLERVSLLEGAEVALVAAKEALAAERAAADAELERAAKLRADLDTMIAAFDEVEADRDRIAVERDKLRADLEAAAGDLPVPVPEPGTDMARLLIANRLLATRAREADRERDQAQASLTMVRHQMRRTHDALTEAGVAVAQESAADRVALLAAEVAALRAGAAAVESQRALALDVEESHAIMRRAVEADRDRLRAAVEEAKRALVETEASRGPIHPATSTATRASMKAAVAELKRVISVCTAALSPAPGEAPAATPDPKDAKIAELRGLLLAFIKAEGAMASDCDGVYPDVFDAIEKTVAALRDPSHPCAMCGGVDWRIRATPGGEYDEVFERCDHQPIEPAEDDDGPLDLSQMGAVLDGLARGLRDLPPPATPAPPQEARGEGPKPCGPCSGSGKAHSIFDPCGCEPECEGLGVCGWCKGTRFDPTPEKASE